MMTAERDPLPDVSGAGLRRSLLERPGLRQFVKFCIVGASSTAIDFGLFYLIFRAYALPARLHAWLAGYPAWQSFADEHHLALMIAATLSFLVSLSNGFFWNRRWTFAHARASSARRQYVQFALVNVVGLVLNLVIIRGTVEVMGHYMSADLAPFGAKVIATAVVVFWNFLANKYWTFSR